MIEKMLEKLEELRMRYFLTIANGGSAMLDFAYGYISETIDHCKEIVQEVAKEYGNGWIPCSERLPEESDEYLVTWIPEFFPKKRYCEIVEYSPEEGWIGKIQQAPFGKYTIIAWQALAPYQKGE